MRNLYSPVDGVEFVVWPGEAARLAELRARHHPRLLLVAAAAAPPMIDDALEDWVRLPAEPRDVEVRARRLASFGTTRPQYQSGGVRA